MSGCSAGPFVGAPPDYDPRDHLSRAVVRLKPPPGQVISLGSCFPLFNVRRENSPSSTRVYRFNNDIVVYPLSPTALLTVLSPSLGSALFFFLPPPPPCPLPSPPAPPPLWFCLTGSLLVLASCVRELLWKPAHGCELPAYRFPPRGGASFFWVDSGSSAAGQLERKFPAPIDRPLEDFQNSLWPVEG